MAKKSRGNGWILDWKGPELTDAVRESIRLAFDETMAECVKEAFAYTPRVTGTLQRSLRFQPTDKALVGIWGSFIVNYAFFVEVGTSRRYGVNMMRNASDKEYPKIDGRVKKYLAKELKKQAKRV